MTTDKCECADWAHPGVGLRTTHHPQCKHRKLELEAESTIRALCEAMEVWAQDEDGIHPDAWVAYRAAKALLGVYVGDDDHCPTEEPAA